MNEMNRRDWLALAAAAGLPLPAGASGPDQPKFPGPDLANLHDILAGVSRDNPPALSFLDPRWKSLDEWKKAARPLFHGLLHYGPKAAPAVGETLRREERDGFVIETVKILATSGYDIPGWLLIPNRRSGRVPGIVAIHCHGGCYVWGHEKIISHPDDPPALLEYRGKAYGRPYAEVLARRGFVVLVIDGFYFGERRLRVEQMDPATGVPYMAGKLRALRELKPETTEWFRAVNDLCHEFENLTAKTIFSAGATWPGLMIWDDMRSVDYLSGRPEVDSSRIGCLGLSIGGLRTAHLIAADARIKAACVTGWMTEFHEQLRNHLRWHTWMIYIPGLYSSLDLPDAAGLTAPGALMVQQCAKDSLYPLEGMRGAVEKLEKIYAKVGIPERFRGVFHDVPHSFTPQMQEEAFAWLEKWI